MATLLSALETQARRHLIEPAALAAPTAPTVTPTGTTGATSYTYKIVAINATGTTGASTGTTTSTGNATLDGTNYNALSWTAVTDATGYWVYRTASGGSPSSVGRLAALGAVTLYNDQGAAGDSGTAPTTNTTGLNQPTWSSAELIDIANKGIKDLWGAIIDLHQEHFLTTDITNVSLAASGVTLSGVPTDVFRVYLIEPKNTTSTGTNRDVMFVPKSQNAKEFVYARSLSAVDPTQPQVYFYDVSQAGAPVGAPTIHIAPSVSSALAAGTIRFIYIPILAAVASSGDNPIPGESDQALIAYIVAFARAKEREDRSPDPNWLAIYANEKNSILVRLTPRQEQEPDVVAGFWEDEW